MLIVGEHIEPDVMFDCGQCFRFIKQSESYRGIVRGRILDVEKTSEGLLLRPVCDEDTELWEDYFDLKTNYSIIEERFARDAVLAKTLQYASGMRILNQEPFETIITFIISANNNVGRIRKIVEAICESCGKEFIYKGKKYYARCCIC